MADHQNISKLRTSRQIYEESIGVHRQVDDGLPRQSEERHAEGAVRAKGRAGPTRSGSDGAAAKEEDADGFRSGTHGLSLAGGCRQGWLRAGLATTSTSVWLAGPSDRLILVDGIQRRIDRADEPRMLVIHRDPCRELSRERALDQPCAETGLLWDRDSRPSFLAPHPAKFSVIGRPGDFDLTLFGRERAVLCRIGAELMDGHRKRNRGPGAEPQDRSRWQTAPFPGVRCGPIVAAMIS